MAIYLLKIGNEKYGLCKEAKFTFGTDDDAEKVRQAEAELAPKRVYSEDPKFLEPPIITELWKLIVST